MKKWKCTICGYIHTGNEPPDECPLCGADASQFVELKEEKERSTATVQAESRQEAPRPQTAQAQATKPALQGIQAFIVRHHLHPISAHTPNGVIPMAALFVLLLVLFGSSRVGQAALLSYTFVLLSMPIVLFTGYTMWKTRYRGAMTTLFKIKITASLVATFLLTILVLWGYGQPSVLQANASGRAAYLFCSLLLVAAVGIAGHLGGKLVFGGRKH